MIYEELIPADHLTRRLSAAVDFSFVPDLVSDYHCPDNGVWIRACSAGISGFPGAVQSRVSAVPVDLSDWQVEEQVNLHLACKWFVGLQPQEPAPDPDHIVLCRFPARLVPDNFQAILNRIVARAGDAGWCMTGGG